MPEWPAPPEITPEAYDELVCLTPRDANALSRYLHEVSEVRRALVRCPLFHVAPE